MERTLNDAMATYQRVKESLPKLHTADPQLYDFVKLGDTVNMLIRALTVFADPLAEVPKKAAKSSIDLCEYYESLAIETLKLINDEK